MAINLFSWIREGVTCKFLATFKLETETTEENTNPNSFYYGLRELGSRIYVVFFLSGQRFKASRDWEMSSVSETAIFLRRLCFEFRVVF